MENARDDWLHGPQCLRNYNDEPDGVVGNKIYTRRWLKSKNHSNMVHFHKCQNLYNKYRVTGLLNQQISHRRNDPPTIPISSSLPTEYDVACPLCKGRGDDGCGNDTVNEPCEKCGGGGRMEHVRLQEASDEFLQFERPAVWSPPIDTSDDNCSRCGEAMEYHQYVNGCPVDDCEIDTSDADARTIPAFGSGIFDAKVHAADWQGLSEIESDSIEPIMNILFFKDGTFSVQLPNEYAQSLDFRKDNSPLDSARDLNLRLVTEPRYEDDKLHIFINPFITPPE